MSEVASPPDSTISVASPLDEIYMSDVASPSDPDL